MADYDQAIRLMPDDANAYYNRGNAKAEKDDWDAAIADYDQALRLKPDDAGIYYNRGNSKYAKDDRDAALADWQEALSRAVAQNLPDALIANIKQKIDMLSDDA